MTSVVYWHHVVGRHPCQPSKLTRM